MEQSQHFQIPIGARYKRLAVFVGLFGLTLEIFSQTLFMWPVDHSCARPPNRTVVPDLLVDSHRQPIDTDAVQRNLFDATPEDPLTLARAKSIGIDYDDIGRCFEYPVDTSNGVETINMLGQLELCRHGWHFERPEPNPSIVDRYELACSRQWLKVLLPQASVVGLLFGLILVSRIKADSHLSGKMPRSVLAWTAVELAFWLVLQIISWSLAHGETPNLRHAQYFRFLFCVFLRSFGISSILWRQLIVWQSSQQVKTTEPLQAAREEDYIKEDYRYLVLFGLAIIQGKIFYMPLILRLFPDWLKLNGFLNMNLLFFVALTCLVELVHDPRSLDLLVAKSFLRGSVGRSESDKETIAGQLIVIESSDNLNLALRNLKANYRHDEGQPNQGSFASPARVCEFCSAKEEMMFREASGELGPHRRNPGIMLTEMQLARGVSQRRLESAAGGESLVSAHLTQDPYRPTTVPIDYAADGSGGGTKHSAASASELDNCRADQLTRAGPSGRLAAAAYVAASHNTSLLEMNLARGSLISKLSLLTFCLALNYFLIQTMPNHELMHAETLASLTERKTNYRRANERKTEPRTIHQATLPTPPVPTAARSKLAYERPSAVNTTTPSAVIGSESSEGHSGSQPPSGDSVDAEIRILCDTRSSPRNSTNPRGDPRERQVYASVASGGCLPPLTSRDNASIQSAALTGQTQHPGARSVGANFTVTSNGSTNAATPNRASMSNVYTYHVDKHLATTTTTTTTTTKKPRLNVTAMARKARLFNYSGVNYAARTLAELASTLNPLRIGWITASLNGWPVELLVLLLFVTNWTNFAATYFKLARLFSLAKHGARLLLLEWLLVGLVPKQNHLLELDWLLALVLIVARFLSTLMFYGHLRTLFKLSSKMSSNTLVEARRLVPLVLAALLAAHWAPVAERTDLVLIPLAIILSNLIIHYLAGNLDAKFRALLCPMMFE